MDVSELTFGWVRDTPDDGRDLRFAFAVAPRPQRFHWLDEHKLSTLNQGPVGSCIGHGVEADLASWAIARRIPYKRPSRLFIYGVARMVGADWRWTTEDTGAMIRDALNGVRIQGAPPEKMWPYDPRKFAAYPDAHVWAAAAGNFRGLRFERIETLDAALQYLWLKRAMPVFGFTVYKDAFQQAAETGDMPMPATRDRAIGGHAVALEGWNDDTRRLTVFNSHGSEFGRRGLFTMPYDFWDQTADWWGVTALETVKEIGE